MARDQYSKISIQWIEWESHKRGIRIRHAFNKGEVRFPAPGRYYKLDAFHIDPVTGENVCLEYNSCVHHGCLCQDRESMDNYNKLTMTQWYTLMVEQVRVLEAAGIKVVMKWDHKFTRIEKRSRTIRICQRIRLGRMPRAEGCLFWRVHECRQIVPEGRR